MAMKFRVSDLHRRGTVWKQVFYFEDDPYAYYPAADEMRRWCEKQFGLYEKLNLAEDRRWSISLDGHSTFFFRDPVDCTAFLLRWS